MVGDFKMSDLNAATQAKKRWNKHNYIQVKVHVSPETASAFKLKCQTAGVSMASVISQCMAEYSETAIKHRQPQSDDASTRKKRRQLLSRATQLLELVRDGEERLKENMPENLQGSVNYETAEEMASKLDDIIDQLSDIY
jgi:glycerol-3-phosphate dehydrogenase